MRPAIHCHRGMVLVMVLWITALLTLLAGSFSYTMRVETRLAQTAADHARAQALAEAGLHYLLVRLFAMNPMQLETLLNIAGSGAGPMSEFADQIIPLDGTPFSWTFEGVELELSVQDTSGLIDLNRASRPLMMGLLRSVGVSPEATEALLDKIEDWRDPDDLVRLQGAEAPEYAAAGLPPPKNGEFETVDELKQVMDMTPELFERLAPALTVHSRQPGFNPKTARPEVLRAIPDLTDLGRVDEYLALRQAARARGEPLPSFPEAGPYASSGINATYHLNVVVTLEQGGQRRISTVAAAGNRRDRLFQLFSYRVGGGSSWR